MRLLLIFIVCVTLVSCSKPLFVTHWSAKDAALLKKKGHGYPAHHWYSRAICFNQKCRKKEAWVRNQRKDRFKGFKDGGKLPPRPPRKLIESDSGLVAQKPPVQQPASPIIVQPKQPEVVHKTDSLIVLGDVLFETGSFHLREDLFPRLDSLVDFLKRNPKTTIVISGHTDNTGREQSNLRLSENRADAVAEYIVDKGIATGRVSFNGFGSSQPIADNSTEQGRRRNRRVEVRIEY